MKKIYVLLFSCTWIIGFSQDYYSLLSGTVWKIKKYNGTIKQFIILQNLFLIQGQEGLTKLETRMFSIQNSSIVLVELWSMAKIMLIISPFYQQV